MATKKKVTKRVKSTPLAAKKRVVSNKGSDFWRVEFNINTVYWMVIGLAVTATAVLTYNSNQQITSLYDSIDAVNMQLETESKPPAVKPQPVNPVAY